MGKAARLKKERRQQEWDTGWTPGRQSSRSDEAVLQQSASQLRRREGSPWHGLPEDRAALAIALFEHFDGYSPLRNGLRNIAHERGDWAGIPMPIDGSPLVIEPTYPNAKQLMAIGIPKDEKEGALYPVRSQFFSTKLRVYVAIVETPDGKRHGVPIIGSGNNVTMALHTLGVSDAWGIEQESNAVHTLGEHVTHRQFKHYMLTGMFLESSKRSGVSYLFRRLRPTLALKAGRDGMLRVMTAMCMHAIGFYSGTWAGAMCPTDDVLAHLMLMRGDEHMFWRRCNQHAAFEPEAGV